MTSIIADHMLECQVVVHCLVLKHVEFTIMLTESYKRSALSKPSICRLSIRGEHVDCCRFN
jgi:hypothetical protein